MDKFKELSKAQYSRYIFLVANSYIVLGIPENCERVKDDNQGKSYYTNKR